MLKSGTSIDEHISNQSKTLQSLLRILRTTIRKAAPEAEETISYGIPTFRLHGNLVHFAGYENHIGFYPGPAAIRVFKRELVPYKTSKGAIQFPIDKPLPLQLVTKIVQFRIKVNLEKDNALFPKISVPALRALQSVHIKTLKDLSKWSEDKLLELHGMGPSTILILRAALKAKRLSFKK